MKNTFKIFAAAVMLSFVASCDKDDDRSNNAIPSSTQITTAYISSGSWRVTLYQEDDDLHTDYFTSYNFVFGADNTLTASNGANTYSGAWSVSNDDSSSDDFNILFAAPSNFAELTEDWDVLESSAVKLRLKHTSGGDGSMDYLTFEKNP